MLCDSYLVLYPFPPKKRSISRSRLPVLIPHPAIKISAIPHPASIFTLIPHPAKPMLDPPFRLPLCWQKLLGVRLLIVAIRVNCAAISSVLRSSTLVKS